MLDDRVHIFNVHVPSEPVPPNPSVRATLSIESPSVKRLLSTFKSFPPSKILFAPEGNSLLFSSASKFPSNPHRKPFKAQIPPLRLCWFQSWLMDLRFKFYLSNGLWNPRDAISPSSFPFPRFFFLGVLKLFFCCPSRFPVVSFTYFLFHSLSQLRSINKKRTHSLSLLSSWLTF